MSKFEIIGDKLLANGKEILAAIGTNGQAELDNLLKFLTGEPSSPSRFVLLPSKTWINGQGTRIFNHLGDEARLHLKNLAEGTGFEMVADVAGQIAENIIETTGDQITSVVEDVLGTGEKPKSKAQLKKEADAAEAEKAEAEKAEAENVEK